MEEFEGLVEKSGSHRVLVFKYSPICSVSFFVDGQVQGFLKSLPEDSDLETVRVDVVNSRPLSRAIADRIQIRHESPQVLLLHEGRCIWHESHGAISRGELEVRVLG